MKDELGGKLMIKFFGLKAKTYSYIIDGGSEDKPKRTTKCVIKRKRKSENHKNCLKATQLENKINYLGKKEINIDSFFVTNENIKNS